LLNNVISYGFISCHTSVQENKYVHCQLLAYVVDFCTVSL